MKTTSKDAVLLETIGTSARFHRLRQNLTLEDLSKESGLSVRFVVDVEAGRVNISVIHLFHMAKALGIPMTALLAHHQPN